MSRASSIHEAEREHAVGELKPFDKLNPFKRSARRTPSGRLEDVALAPALAIPGAPANPTPTYIPASFGDSSSSPLVRNGSRPAVPGLFGGAAPDERDHGYPAPASAEEAKERDLRREQSRARRALAQPRGNEAGLTRGPSLVEAAANLATAGFGLGESNAEVVQRTLSRVSTHRSYTARPGQSAPRTITHPAHHEDSSSSSGQTIIGSDETDQEKKARQEVADAGVGLNGGEGGNATNARRIADAEKGASAPEQDHDMSEEELFMARFEPGEKINPKEWSVAYRWYITGLGSLLVLNSTFASSAPSGVIREMIEYFGFGREVAILTVSLFVAGYCVGPLLWGPFSESYGRRPIFIVSFIGYIGFQVGCALSKNTASILIFRFLGGTFASCPLTNAGALLADIWDADRRGIAMALFGLAPFAGPATAPMIAGYIGVSGTSWRWLFWVLCFFASFCGLLVLFTLPETYAPILLVKKAQILRKETGDDRWWAPLEKQDKTFGTVVKNVLVKPFKILALEPMLIAITVYMSFVYGW
jgi:multidrug resistance protein